MELQILYPHILISSDEAWIIDPALKNNEALKNHDLLDETNQCYNETIYHSHIS